MNGSPVGFFSINKFVLISFEIKYLYTNNFIVNFSICIKLPDFDFFLKPISLPKFRVYSPIKFLGYPFLHEFQTKSLISHINKLSTLYNDKLSESSLLFPKIVISFISKPWKQKFSNTFRIDAAIPSLFKPSKTSNLIPA